MLPRDRWLWGLVAAGLLLRLVAAVWTDPVSVFIADDNVYNRGAAAWRMTGTLETGELVRPPLYFFYIAAFQGLTRDWPLLAKLVQCLAGALTAIPAYRAAFRVGGERAARLAAGFLLFDPTLVAYAHLLWPETLFLFVVALVFDGASGLAPGRPLRATALGVATGAAMLLKPVFGLFTVILFFAWLRRFGWQGAFAIALAFGGAAALAIAPWVVRNQLRYGPAVVIENEGPYSFWVGNDPRSPDAVHGEWKEIGDPQARSARALRGGAAAIAADPAAFAARSAVRAVNLWGFEWFVVRNVIHGGYGRVDRGTLLAVFWTLQLAHALVFVLAASALGGMWRDPTLRLVLVYAAVFTLLVSVMVSTTRWRVPFAYPLAIGAGLAVDRLLRRRVSRAGLVAAGVAGVLLALSAARPPASTLFGGDFAKVAELRRPDWFYFRY